VAENHLKTFDTLDFDVFSNQKWDRLRESHAKDIVVTWPDRHETRGLDTQIETGGLTRQMSACVPPSMRQ